MNSTRDPVSPEIEIQKQEFNVASSTLSPHSDNAGIQTFQPVEINTIPASGEKARNRVPRHTSSNVGNKSEAIRNLSLGSNGSKKVAENMYRRRSNSRGSQGSKNDTLDQINQENNYSLANQKPQFGSQPTNKNSVVLLSGGSMHDRKSSFGSHQGANNQSY